MELDGAPPGGADARGVYVVAGLGAAAGRALPVRRVFVVAEDEAGRPGEFGDAFGVELGAARGVGLAVKFVGRGVSAREGGA